MAAIALLTIGVAAYEGERLRAGLLAAPNGQIEAARAFDMSRWLILRCHWLPAQLSAFLGLLAYLVGRAEARCARRWEIRTGAVASCSALSCTVARRSSLPNIAPMTGLLLSGSAMPSRKGACQPMRKTFSRMW